MRRVIPSLTRRTLLAGPLTLALLAAGCSRPVAVPGDGVSTQTDPHAPFQAERTKPENVPGELTVAGSKADAPTNSLPFHDGENLPAGTLINVRLQTPISVDHPEPSDPFEAVVAEPVVIDGNTVIPRGTVVSGRVESARTSKLKRNRGYVRLALASVDIAGVDVPIQTASLFARQSPLNDNSPAIIHLEKGRRLTFSLAEPVYLVAQRAVPSH